MPEPDSNTLTPNNPDPNAPVPLAVTPAPELLSTQLIAPMGQPELTPESYLRQEQLNTLVPSTDAFGGPQLGFEPDPSFLEGVISGGSQFGIIVGGAEWISSLLDPDINNAPMEDYSIQQFVNDDPSRLDVVTHSLEKEKQGDKGHANLMNLLRDTVNPRQAEDVIERIKQYEYAKRISEEAGWGGWLIGAAGSVSIDMVASVAYAEPL